MTERTLEECMDILKQNDTKTLEDRAERLRQLGVTENSFYIQREWDYSTEAASCYINRCFRSSIFASACAIQQVFMFAYLQSIDYKEADFEMPRFGTLIQKCEGIGSLSDHIQAAKLLNKIRNKVAAHPLFVDTPSTNIEETKARNKLLLRNIKVLLNLVGEISPETREQIESESFDDQISNMQYSLKDATQSKIEIPYSIWMFLIFMEGEILNYLAKEAMVIVHRTTENYNPGA
jgi:hypothetical protein